MSPLKGNHTPLKRVCFLARREVKETKHINEITAALFLRTGSACRGGACLRQPRQIYCLYMLSVLPELCRHACCKDTLGVYLIDVNYVKYTFRKHLNGSITFAPGSQNIKQTGSIQRLINPFQSGWTKTCLD